MSIYFLQKKNVFSAELTYEKCVYNLVQEIKNLITGKIRN